MSNLQYFPFQELLTRAIKPSLQVPTLLQLGTTTRTSATSIINVQEHSGPQLSQDLTEITPTNVTSTISSACDNVIRVEQAGDRTVSDIIPGVQVRPDNSITQLKLMAVLPGQFKDIAHRQPAAQNDGSESTHPNIRIERMGERNITDIIPGVTMKSSSSVEKPKVITVFPSQLKNFVHKGITAQNSRLKLTNPNVETGAQKSVTPSDGNHPFETSNIVPEKPKAIPESDLTTHRPFTPNDNHGKVVYVKDPKRNTFVKIAMRKKTDGALGTKPIIVCSKLDGRSETQSDNAITTEKADHSREAKPADNSSLVPRVIQTRDGKIHIKRIAHGISIPRKQPSPEGQLPQQIAISVPGQVLEVKKIVTPPLPTTGYKPADNKPKPIMEHNEKPMVGMQNSDVGSGKNEVLDTSSNVYPEQPKPDGHTGYNPDRNVFESFSKWGENHKSDEHQAHVNADNRNVMAVSEKPKTISHGVHEKLQLMGLRKEKENTGSSTVQIALGEGVSYASAASSGAVGNDPLLNNDILGVTSVVPSEATTKAQQTLQPDNNVSTDVHQNVGPNSAKPESAGPIPLPKKKVFKVLYVNEALGTKKLVTYKGQGDSLKTLLSNSVQLLGPESGKGPEMSTESDDKVMDQSPNKNIGDNHTESSVEQDIKIEQDVKNNDNNFMEIDTTLMNVLMKEESELVGNNEKVGNKGTLNETESYSVHNKEPNLENDMIKGTLKETGSAGCEKKEPLLETGLEALIKTETLIEPENDSVQNKETIFGVETGPSIKIESNVMIKKEPFGNEAAKTRIERKKVKTGIAKGSYISIKDKTCNRTKYFCSICYYHADKKPLILHLKLAHKTTQCKVCSGGVYKMFRNGSKKRVVYQCDKCHHCFKTPHGLHKHSLKHKKHLR